ncbi:TonB-dependent receptor plug domain-containing protein [Comamonas sp. GB3 AK4-5]|uniref:TonB-dependent receptor plug domain-containing protein n=1 Tax=Comamonas sp. GB3 AK4-5 TaxID=3231487 RepID=UPI00351EEE8C
MDFQSGSAPATLPSSRATSLATSTFRATPLALALCLAMPVLAQEAAQQQEQPVKQTKPTQTVLEDVTVTATMSAHDVRTAPASVSVVNRKKLDERMPANLMEAVQDEPGVGFNVISTAGRKTLSLRGMESKHILTMVDGKRIAGSDDVVGHSDYSLGWVPMVAVERVEIIRGPMSTLYGSEALGGVVNMITREPGDTWKTSVLLKAGTQTDRSGGGFTQQSIYSAGKVNDVLSLKLSGTNARNSDIPGVLNPQVSELEGAHNMQGGVGGILNLAQGHKLDFNVIRGKDERFFDTSSGKKGTYRNGYDINRSHADIGWRGELAGWTGKARAYMSRIESINTPAAGVDATAAHTLKEQVLDTSFSRSFKDHMLTWGGEFRRESLEHEGLTGGKTNVNHQALFVQDEWALARSLVLTSGLRLDHHARFGNELSPRLYAVWTPTEELVIKGGYSHAFRAPNLKQGDPNYVYSSSSYIYYGNGDLKPESVNSFELGASWKTSAAELSATLFHNNVRDLISSERLGKQGSTTLNRYVNVNKAKITGLELGANWELARQWSWINNATVLMSAKDATTGNRLNYRPRYSVNSALQWEGEDGWAARVGLRHVGSHQASATIGLPAYNLWNASLSKRLSKTYQIGVALENIGNVKLAERSSDFKTAERGRAISVSLQADF